MVLLPNAANAIKTVLVGHNQGATWMNTLYFHAQGSFGDSAAATAGLLTFSGAVATAWNTHLAQLCSDEVVLTDVNSSILTARDSPQVFYNLPTAAVGTRAGTALPTSAACCISWRSSLRYRGGHGRIYVPAGVVADIELGRRWTSDFRDDATTAAQGFHTLIDGLSVGSVQVNHVVLSYFSGSHKTPENRHPDPVLRSSPLPIPIVQATVGGRVDTQRRRLGKETL